MKFIPGRSLLPEDRDTQRHVSEGHIFTEDTIPTDPRVLMADFVAYILGRPKEAVPHDVRELLRPEGMDEGLWPGSILPRSVFMPNPNEVPDYFDQDIKPFQEGMVNKPGDEDDDASQPPAPEGSDPAQDAPPSEEPAQYNDSMSGSTDSSDSTPTPLTTITTETPPG